MFIKASRHCFKLIEQRMMVDDRLQMIDDRGWMLDVGAQSMPSLYHLSSIIRPCHLSLVTINLSAMATCPVCSKRASKRYCPALKTKICAVCCAEKRMIELACPEECPYLRSARDSMAARERELRQRETAAQGGVRAPVTERMLPFLLTIENAIVTARRGTKGAAINGLNDEEALAAIENAIRNIQTEESGLIYEHHAASPRIEEVSRRIRVALDELIARMPGEHRPQRAEIIESLERIRDQIRLHIKRGEGPVGYIRFISLFLPWPKEASGPQIIT